MENKFKKANSTLVMRLRSCDEPVIRGVETRLQFRREGSNVSGPITRSFASGRECYQIPAFKTGLWNCSVEAKRFEIRDTAFFRPIAGQRIELVTLLPRNPGAGWKARFDPWSCLIKKRKFSRLATLLQGSSKLWLRSRNGSPRCLGKFADRAYDNVISDELIRGKAGLLNLHAKLRDTRTPDRRGTPWLNFIQELLAVQPDRVVGTVSPKMAEIVKQIHTNPDSFLNYKKAPARRHFEKNIKPVIPSGARFKRNYSIKTVEKVGVLQLVIAEVLYPDGQTVYLLDADIDENGNVLKHLGDYIKHKFSSGTHPFHIYDLLHATCPNRFLGYRLE